MTKGDLRRRKVAIAMACWHLTSIKGADRDLEGRLAEAEGGVCGELGRMRLKARAFSQFAGVPVDAPPRLCCHTFMPKHHPLVLLSTLNWFFLCVRRLVVPMLCGLMLLFNADCSLSMGDLQYSAPKAETVQICDKPLDVPACFQFPAVQLTGLGGDFADNRGFGGRAKNSVFWAKPKRL